MKMKFLFLSLSFTSVSLLDSQDCDEKTKRMCGDLCIDKLSKCRCGNDTDIHIFADEKASGTSHKNIIIDLFHFRK